MAPVARTRARLAMPGDRTDQHLCRALERGEFSLHYQPQVDLATDEVVGFEALVRWDDPQRGLRLAAEFVPMFERRNLLGTLRAWVLDNAARQATRWRSLPGRPRVWVNLTREAFAPRADLVGLLRTLLLRHELSGEHLGLEFGGALDATELDEAVRVLRGVRDLGIDVALDHVGTGAALAGMRFLPVTTVKIERMFTAGLGVSGADTAVVAAVTDLSHALGRVVVGEGVEDERTLDWLRRLGVDRAQGHYLGTPVAVDPVSVMPPGRVVSRGPRAG